MNLLPSLLVATTIISSVQPIQIGNASIDATVIMPQSNKQCITGQVIIGNASDAETILDKLCINLEDIFNNCLRPSLPAPEQKPDNGETETPE